MPVWDGKPAREDRGVSRPGLGDGVILLPGGEHDPLVEDALEATGPFCAVAQQLVGAQLVDHQQDDQAGHAVNGSRRACQREAEQGKEHG